MAEGPRALLITGPGGSGKSTLAQGIGQRPGWTGLSEDEYWVGNGWGQGLRRPDQERVIQAQVARDLLAATAAGRSVALEFILYKAPPNPLTAYQQVLADNRIAHATIVLKPSVDEVLRRTEQRGRPSDVAHLDRRRTDAEWQLRVLESGFVDPEWVIDPTGRTIDDLSRTCLARLDHQA